MLEEKDGSSTEQGSGLAGSGCVAIPKARLLHRVWGSRFAPLASEPVGEGGEPVFAEGSLENSSLWWDGFHLESRKTINRNDIFIELLCRVGLRLKSKFS